MILRVGYGGKIFRLVRRGSKQSVKLGTPVHDRDGTLFEVVGGQAPHKEGRAGFVHIARPGTSLIHQPYAPAYGFEWLEHGLDRRRN